MSLNFNYKTLLLLCLLLLSANLVYAADSNTTPVNKVSARATPPVLTFFRGTETGHALSVFEAARRTSFGIRLSEVPTADVKFTLAVLSSLTTARPLNDYIIPDPDNTGVTLTSINIVIPAGGLTTAPADKKMEADFKIDIIDNALDGDDRVLAFSILNLTGALTLEKQLVITIRDDELPPLIELKTKDISIQEQEASVEMDIKLVGSRSSKDIVIDYVIETSQEMYAFGSNNEPDYFEPSTDFGQPTSRKPGKIVILAEKEDYKFNFEFIDNVIAENQDQLTFKLVSAENASISDTKNQVIITVNDDDSTQSKLTDTGVTNCYDGTNSPVNCLSSVDFPMQDAATTTSRNFVKIDASGQRVSEGVEWTCVYDLETGLLWEKKPTQTNLFQYTWFNPAGSVNGGGEGTEGGQRDCGTPPCDTANHVKILNEENVIGRCGVRKWRVPNLTELMSLLDFEPPAGGTLLIDTLYFPETAFLAYWTSTPSAINKDDVWCVNFQKANRNQVGLCQKTQSRALRLVSTCKLGSAEVEC